MDKEIVIHLYNGELFNHKKEWIWISYSEVDEPRVYYTEWSKPERNTPIQYTNAYIWNLEKWCWWTYLQENNGDTDIENRLVDTVGEGEGGMDWENSTETFVLSYVKQLLGTCYVPEGLNSVLCDNLEGWEEVGRFKKEGIYVWCSVAQSGPTFCNPMDCSMPGFPVPHHLPEFAQVHVHWIGDAIKPSYPLSPSSSAFNIFQGLFQWVGCSHQVAKVFELQLHHPSLPSVFRGDFL